MFFVWCIVVIVGSFCITQPCLVGLHVSKYCTVLLLLLHFQVPWKSKIFGSPVIWSVVKSPFCWIIIVVQDANQQCNEQALSFRQSGWKRAGVSFEYLEEMMEKQPTWWLNETDGWLKSQCVRQILIHREGKGPGHYHAQSTAVEEAQIEHNSQDESVSLMKYCK